MNAASPSFAEKSIFSLFPHQNFYKYWSSHNQFWANAWPPSTDHLLGKLKPFLVSNLDKLLFLDLNFHM